MLNKIKAFIINKSAENILYNGNIFIEYWDVLDNTYKQLLKKKIKEKLDRENLFQNITYDSVPLLIKTELITKEYIDIILKTILISEIEKILRQTNFNIPKQCEIFTYFIKEIDKEELNKFVVNTIHNPITISKSNKLEYKLLIQKLTEDKTQKSIVKEISCELQKEIPNDSSDDFIIKEFYTPAAYVRELCVANLPNYRKYFQIDNKTNKVFIITNYSLGFKYYYHEIFNKNPKRLIKYFTSNKSLKTLEKEAKDRIINKIIEEYEGVIYNEEILRKRINIEFYTVNNSKDKKEQLVGYVKGAIIDNYLNLINVNKKSMEIEVENHPIKIYFKEEKPFRLNEYGVYEDALIDKFLEILNKDFSDIEEIIKDEIEKYNLFKCIEIKDNTIHLKLNSILDKLINEFEEKLEEALEELLIDDLKDVINLTPDLTEDALLNSINESISLGFKDSYYRGNINYIELKNLLEITKDYLIEGDTYGAWEAIAYKYCDLIGIKEEIILSYIRENELPDEVEQELRENHDFVDYISINTKEKYFEYIEPEEIIKLYKEFKNNKVKGE